MCFPCEQGSASNTIKSGIILSIVGFDGERGIVPLLVAHVPTESEYYWVWTLNQFLAAFSSVMDSVKKLAFFADLGKGFRAALPKVLPDAQLAFCIKHRKVGACSVTCLQLNHGMPCAEEHLKTVCQPWLPLLARHPRGLQLSCVCNNTWRL